MSSTTSPIRIALFLCDKPIATVQATDGDYTSIFGTLLRKSLPAEAGVEYSLDPYDVREALQYPENIDDYRAIIMTGSAASAYENLEWINRLVDYVRDVATNKPHIKLIGICFGHQIIARALGGECVPNSNWEISITELQLTDIGKKLFGADSLNIHQMHRDHVPTVPPSFHLLGSTSITPNQGMVRLRDSANPGNLTPEDVQIFTVQGHPEFTERIVTKIIDARQGTGVIGGDVAEDGKRRVVLRNDGVDVVGNVIWRVLGVGSERTGS